MPNTSTTPTGASSVPCPVRAPNGAVCGSVDELGAIIDVDRALRRIDGHYLPSEEEIAAAAGVTTADVRGALGTTRRASFGTLASTEDADE